MSLVKDRLTNCAEVASQADQPAPLDRESIGTSRIRKIRRALGMSTEDLGLRLGISGPGVVQLEQSEASETIRLNSLIKAANALNCDVHISIVPRVPLQQMVEDQARSLAHEIAMRVGNTMALESQAVSSEFLHSQIEEIYQQLLVSRGLWRKVVEQDSTLI